MRTKIQVTAAALAVVFLSVSATQAADPAVKCEAGKLKTAGKYSSCRLSAESKGVKKGEAPDYSKCVTKFSDKWGKDESKAGPGVCPSEGDEASIDAHLTLDAAEVATLLAGGTLPTCGDDSVNVAGEQCDGVDLDGYSCVSLGHFGGSLACDESCDFDVAGCDCSSLGGVDVGGFCWFLGVATDCDTACADAGLVYSAATLTYAGTGGTVTQCYAVMDALGQTSPPFVDIGDIDCLAEVTIAVSGIGCAVTNPSFPLRIRCTATPTVSSASHPNLSRACACE